jgi:hypothetical protein
MDSNRRHLFFDVENLADRDLAILATADGGDLDQLIGISKGERPEKKCIDEAEDGGGAANRQTEGYDDRRSEA